jgi:predicted RNA-binding protein with PIN domain
MPYLVDGHNLIPKLGLRLDSPDDEMQLVSILQEFARLSRRDVEVYFDGAPAGQARTKKFGRLTAHFVRVGIKADDAIKQHLKRLAGAARNWTVVTSDRDIQVAAREAHAHVLTSDAFAQLLTRQEQKAERLEGEHEMTTEEIADWLKLFRNRG